MARIIICSVVSCDKKARQSCAFCAAHQHRLKRYGDPLGAPAPRLKLSCSVAECDRKHFGRGFCVKHYKRWRSHGDPLAGGIDHGAAQSFLKTAAASTSEDCIPWPFGKVKEGYGRANWQGVPMGAHVAVAIIKHGQKPSPDHEVCHRCGNGHLACVNGNHIYWGTRSDNVQDAMRHGTSYWTPGRKR